LQVKTDIIFDFSVIMALGVTIRNKSMGKLRESLDAIGNECGLPTALEAMGERWSFMILRGAFNGIKHFEEFLSEIGIARNILASRLTKLTESGILHRTPCPDDRRKVEYRLTEKGLELLPAMIALRQWGEKWGTGIASNPVLADEHDRQPILPVSIRSHDNRVLGPLDLCWIDVSEIKSIADARCTAGQGSIRKLSGI
jgi:DNA-binding HxlR family transcriptional regulator